MSQPAAKLGDQIVSRRTYTITAGIATTVLIEGRCAAVLGSNDPGGAQVISGCVNVLIENRPATRAGDLASTDKGPGTVIAIGTVLIG
ncbi:MAG: hypothetical protein AB7P14_20510 [Blastocatellales bacterium]